MEIAIEQDEQTAIEWLESVSQVADAERVPLQSPDDSEITFTRNFTPPVFRCVKPHLTKMTVSGKVSQIWMLFTGG